MNSQLSPKSRITLIRNELGLSVTQFAEKIKIPHATISNIENGKGEVTMKTVTAICRTFNISPAWLGFGIGEKYVNKEGIREFTEAQRRAAEEFQKKIEEINKYPYEKFLEKTIEPSNFKDRNPWVKAPGLFKLLEDRNATEKLLFTSDELNMLEKAIESNPALYNQADSELFLQLIKSYRKQRLNIVEQFIGNKKANPVG